MLTMVYNHVVLPPQLPGVEDANPGAIGSDLMTRLAGACGAVKSLIHGNQYARWDAIHRSLLAAKRVNTRGKINRASLALELQQIRPDQTLILYVGQQNAGMLITQQQNPVQTQNLIVEAFEASPIAKKVIAAKGALEWDFPGSSVLLPPLEFTAAFQESLAAFLAQASREPIKQFVPLAHKAKSDTTESRETVDCAFVSHALMGLFEIKGQAIFPPKLRKRIRDDVCHSRGNPWRRSPLWLVLRAGIQRQFHNLCGNDEGRACYKVLMCTLHAQLLEDIVQDGLNPELISLLKTKLCRRLAKLAFNRQTIDKVGHNPYGSLMDACDFIFRRAIQSADLYIRNVWEKFKNKTKRPIPHLPLRANPEDCHLSLPNSQSYLNSIVADPFPRTKSRSRLATLDLSSVATKRYRTFADLYGELSKLETEAEIFTQKSISDLEGYKDLEKAGNIVEQYISTITGTRAYYSNAEQKSIMILTLMELWITMDKCALLCFPLLEEFRPTFTPASLDCLRLPLFKDMSRLQSIQDYLQDRHTACGQQSLTIFDDPKTGCFAERYFNESPSSEYLYEIWRKIEYEADAQQAAKWEEWASLRARYDKLIREAAQKECICDEGEIQNSEHDCPSCRLEEQAERIKIQIYERPLPSDVVQSKVIVFELACPELYAIYRDTTWQILATLCENLNRLKYESSKIPLRLKLKDHWSLQDYCNFAPSRVSLTSMTKSFTQTHYKMRYFPLLKSETVKPTGLRFAYCDEETSIWLGRQPIVSSFEHCCRLALPLWSPFATINTTWENITAPDGLTSNAIIASQVNCPSESNPHEYMAFQNVLSGTNRRWPFMLIELGSSNLNFNTEEVNKLFSWLANHAGPGSPLAVDNADETFDIGEKEFDMSHPQNGQSRCLRIMHSFFQDTSFCERLLRLLDERMDNISSNWHETNCMDTLITLSLRLCSLVRPFHECVYTKARASLDRLRCTTFRWITELRSEMEKARDERTFRRLSSYLLSISLLCRRTFSSFSEGLEMLHPVDLQTFIEASVILQDNLPDDPSTLEIDMKQALVRDLKMTHRMKDLIKSSFEANPTSLISAIVSIWPQPDGAPPQSYVTPLVLGNDDGFWVQVIAESEARSEEQHLHYHLLSGHLIIDGQSMKRLPPKYMRSGVVQRLLGTQSFQTYPSNMPGMDYVLGVQVQGHQIHLGRRKSATIVRACIRNTVLELIPPEVFRTSEKLDMPGCLVEDHDHWLNVESGSIEIRPQTDTWREKSDNWQLNFNTREAHKSRDSFLVDPHCNLFRTVAETFDHFELANQLQLCQPLTGPLSIYLHSLQLSFTVNYHGFLQSRELCQEIDPHQDAGTWYGLDSKLILRDIANARKRSILVPFGTVVKKKSDIHMSVTITPNGEGYGLYTINDILGRIDCVSEAQLLYLKALFHACTSFVVPDSLTGKTGTEEALQFLQSASCQPWAPISMASYNILTQIADLTAVREYYPLGFRFMQTVDWKDNLTMTVQHDAFWKVVQAIVEKSQQLGLFAIPQVEYPPLVERVPNQYLHIRGLCRRLMFERRVVDVGQDGAHDKMYNSRCQRGQDKYRRNIVNLKSLAYCVCRRPSELVLPNGIPNLFQKWPRGGFRRPLNKVSFSDQLTVDLSRYWGRLVRLFRDSGRPDVQSLLFLILVLSFSSEIEIVTLRIFVAFAILPKLKRIPLPKASAELPEWVEQVCAVLDQHRGELQLPLELFPPDAVRPPRESYLHLEIPTFAERLVLPCKSASPLGKPQPHHVSFDAIRKQKGKMPLPVAEHVAARTGANDAQTTPEVEELEKIVDHLSGSRSLVRKRYSDDLLQSIQALKQLEGGTSSGLPSVDIQSPLIQIAHAKTTAEQCSSRICQAIDGSDPWVFWLQEGGLWPCTNAVPVLEHLRSTSSCAFGEGMKEAILDYALSMVALQRLLRIEDARLRNKPNRVVEEIQNPGHSNWEPEQYPDWLLLEIDANLLIRPVQVDVALATINPPSGQNSVLQMNMGQGWWSPSYFLEFKKPSLECRILPFSFPYTCSYGQPQLARPGPGVSDKRRICTTLRVMMSSFSIQCLKYGNKILQLRTTRCSFSPYTKQVHRYSERSSERGAGAIAGCLDYNQAIPSVLAKISEFGTTIQCKTSVIMPMVAAKLADSNNIARVCVPSALLSQTAQLLHNRLSGLLGRKIGHVPFSRKTPTTKPFRKVYHELHKEMLQSSGIMITLPEHIMSFMLSWRQHLLDSHIKEATVMSAIDHWLQHHCRDIVDECDFTFSTKTQLIYPVGAQQAVDGYPYRWEIAQSLLRRVNSHLWDLQNEYPQSVEVVRKDSGGFPFVYFLRKDVEEELLERLTTDTCSGRIAYLPRMDCSESDASCLRAFIRSNEAPQKFTNWVRYFWTERSSVKKLFYLARGLVGNRILLVALKKRWNVQYGVHPARDPVAVPFHAKGVPSERAEWGHPDVAILLTCLSFYHSGLSLDQLRQSLKVIRKSPDPTGEYDRWTHNSETLPESLRTWDKVKVDDAAQLREIWSHLRSNTSVIDYFLNSLVFPKHAKQFLVQLQASGWDLPIVPSCTRCPAPNPASRTTGFSGTNDNRNMLPFTIKQNDLPSLSHTNAEVLTYLLQPRNNFCQLAEDENGRFSEARLLQQISSMGINILIDAGAQILEMDNKSLVESWLAIQMEAPAALYFNSKDKAMIRYRNGSEISFLASPFADHLDDVLVYLDEAHTRGTDLKFPSGARGALTLGLGITKDALVQAAMRLRQLGSSQSVVFFASPEVHQSIKDHRPETKPRSTQVDSSDIVAWLLAQTCDSIEQQIPLFISQGADYCRSIQAKLDHSPFLDNEGNRTEYVKSIQHSEQDSLIEFYGLKEESTPGLFPENPSPRIAPLVDELQARCRDFRITREALQNSAEQEVEQEREEEVQVQRETVREVQKPVRYETYRFLGLDPVIVRFAETGTLSGDPHAYRQFFSALRDTSVGEKYGLQHCAMHSQLYASKAFLETVVIRGKRHDDNFLRPVNWILWSTTTGVALIVNPEEADLIIPLVRKQVQPAKTHLLTYAAPVTRRMLRFNQLHFLGIPSLPAGWTAPAWFRLELGLFAGRLYSDDAEYEELRRFLGPGIPLEFLQDWLAVRRKGQPFSNTPIGRICQGMRE